MPTVSSSVHVKEQAPGSSKKRNNDDASLDTSDLPLKREFGRLYRDVPTPNLPSPPESYQDSPPKTPPVYSPKAYFIFDTLLAYFEKTPDDEGQGFFFEQTRLHPEDLSGFWELIAACPNLENWLGLNVKYTTPPFPYL